MSSFNRTIRSIGSFFLRTIRSINSFFLGISAGLILPLALGFLFLPTVFVYPSMASVGQCVIGFIGSSICIGFSILYDDFKQQKGLLSGYLLRFSKCSFHKFSLSDYAEQDSPNTIDFKGVPYPSIGIYKNPRDIQIYVVKRGQSQVLPNQLAAYVSYQHSAPSYIFLRDEPDKITPLGRFFLYHEIGHSSWRQTDLRLVTHFGWRFFLLPLPWVLINLQYNKSSILALSIYIALLVITYPVFNYLLQEVHFYEEVNADRFGLSLLATKSRNALKDFLERTKQLPKDPSLNDTQNRKRSTFLLRSLVSNEFESTYNSLPFSLIYLQFLFAIVIVVLGFFMRQPSVLQLSLSGIFSVVLFIVAGIVQIRSKSIRERVEKSIAGIPYIVDTKRSLSMSIFAFDLILIAAWFVFQIILIGNAIFFRNGTVLFYGLMFDVICSGLLIPLLFAFVIISAVIHRSWGMIRINVIAMVMLLMSCVIPVLFLFLLQLP